MTEALHLDVRVTDVKRLTKGIKLFTLAANKGGLLPSFSAGANIALLIAGDRTGQFLRRNYTLVSEPSHREFYQIAVQYQPDGRGASRLIHECFTIGTKLQITAPFNLFPIERSARRHLLIAGGIGITPLWAIARELKREGRDFDLHYAAQSKASAAFVSECEVGLAPNFHFYDSEKGVRLNIEALLSSERIGTRLYVCGPERLVEAVRAAAATIGWPASAVLFEKFTSNHASDAYQIELRSSGQTLTVEQGASMLETLEAAAVPIKSLCRSGACGLCETKIHICEGKIEHKDHILDANERATSGLFYPCVSHFSGKRLVLDL